MRKPSQFDAIIVGAGPSGNAAASTLANNLRGQCRAVTLAEKAQLRQALLNARANVAVLDLELFTLPEVKQICNEFRNVSVVCTHRIADETLWTRVMDAGASAFYEKPFSPLALLKEIEAVARRSQPGFPRAT